MDICSPCRLVWIIPATEKDKSASNHYIVKEDENKLLLQSDKKIRC